MASILFSKRNFIVPYSEGDQVAYIRNINNKIIFKIDPWNVLVSYILDVRIIVKTRGTDNLIEIPFSSHTEAVESLTIFQAHIDEVKLNTTNIDKSIIDYIDNKIIELIQNSKFSYHQKTPKDTWQIPEHPLDKKPSVTITNESFEVIEGFVKFIDDSNVSVQFNIPITGWVFYS